MADFLTTRDLQTPPGGGSAAVRFPANLGQPPFEKWMLFEVKSGRHILRTGVKAESGDNKDSTVKSVALYLPPDALNSSLSVTWQQDDYGAVAGAAVARALQTKSTAEPVSTLSAGGVIPALLDGLKSSVAVGSREVAADVLTKVGGIGGGVVNGENVIAGLTGTITNPRTDIFFKSVEYRTHQFSFQMVPRSLTEARAIDEILNTFQFYMLPSFGGENTVDAAFIGYPYEFEITMFTQATGSGSTHHINSIDRSVLESCIINHASNGSRVAFVDQHGQREYYPASTLLTLAFKEVRLQGRNQQKKIWRGENNKWTESRYPDARSGAGIEQRILSDIGNAAKGAARSITDGVANTITSLLGQ